MKNFKYSALLIALAACAGAQAQVTISGFADVDIESVKSGGASRLRETSGGLNTSRIQFKAEEDLGGGLRAKAVHELTFAVDSGAAGTPRETYVQLSSPDWGDISMGRLNLPSYYIYGYADPAFAADYSMVNNMVVFYAPFREDNSIVYNTPRLGGVQGKLGMTMGKEDGTQNGRVTSVGIDYRNGPFYIGLASDGKSQKNIFTPAVMETSRDTYLASVYRAGPVDWTFIYSRYSGYYAFPPFVDFRSSGRNVQLGARWNINGTSRVYASLVRKTDQGGAASKLSDATGVVLGYLYGLSKRTDLYATFATVRHAKDSSLRYPVSFSAANPLSNENPQGVAIGIRHAF